MSGDEEEGVEEEEPKFKELTKQKRASDAVVKRLLGEKEAWEE